MNDGLPPVGNGSRVLAIAAMVLLALACGTCATPAGAAQLLAVPPHPGQTLLAVASWSAGRSLLWLDNERTPRAAELPDDLRAEGLVWTDNLGVVLLGNGQIVQLGRSPDPNQFSELGRGPRQVRAAVKLSGDRIVALSGGRFRDGGIVEAEASMWDLSARPRRLWDGPGPRVNVRCLTAGMLGGRPSVLIGVEKTAIFDPVFRMRPWIYHLQDSTLSPLWKGTSFAQPYLSALFADISPHHPHDEVCSLELTADGQRQITVYRWHGFVMEGIAQSAPGRYGEQLRQAEPASGQPSRLFVWHGGDSGQIVGLTVDRWPQYQVAELRHCCATDTIPRPPAWDVSWTADGAVAYALSKSGALMILPLDRLAER